MPPSASETSDTGSAAKRACWENMIRTCEQSLLAPEAETMVASDHYTVFLYSGLGWDRAGLPFRAVNELSRQPLFRPPADSTHCVNQFDATSESDGTIFSTPGLSAAGFDHSRCMLAGPVPCTYSTLIDARCFAASQVLPLTVPCDALFLSMTFTPLIQ